MTSASSKPPQDDQPELVAADVNDEKSVGPQGEVRRGDPDLETVLAAYRAFALGDIDAAVANMAEDVVWVEPDEFPDGGRYDGRDAVAGYLRRSRDSWERLHSVPVARRVDNTIAVRHFLEGIGADGIDRKAEVADIFTVRNGLIVHMQAYADPDRAFRD
ncbi:nuclear transport factor 2 family protein [Kribbella sp. NPDC026611]|uniref:nuclear transport factor 2 family protein n=1 Tax=Kribbella sp. NPDC026611 TaxID=3154911 RepID=UPI00340B6626